MRTAIRLLSAILLVALLHLGCKKHTAEQPVSQSLLGAWELRETSAAMSPNNITYPPGNQNTITFGVTQYRLTKPGQPAKTGQYVVVPDNTVSTSVCLVFPTGTYTNRVIYDGNDSVAKTFYQIDADGQRLTFYSGCYAYDAGHSEVYARIAEPLE